jgi:hypothetical protein
VDLQTVLSILRIAMMTLLPTLVASGKLTSDQASDLQNAIMQAVPSLMAAGAAIWAVLHSQQQKVAVKEAAASGVPVQAAIFSSLTPSPAAAAVAAGATQTATGAKTP